MGSGISSGALEDFELHALVDGHIDDERRAALFRRLATSPADRARMEAWQWQNDLMRSTFAGIEREPLPAMLDLSAKARLQCVPANDAPLAPPAGETESGSARRVHVAAVLATIAVITMGLGGSWFLIDTSRPEAAPIPAALVTAEPVITDGLAHLPTTRIPDLSPYGFRFMGADTASGPSTILFRYQHGAEHVRVSVSRASTADVGAFAPVWTGEGFGWHRQGAAFAISGTAKPDRLRAIAAGLQKEKPLD